MNAKDMTNEELAAILWAMGMTGVTRDERSYLEEAADRLGDRAMTNTDIYELFFTKSSIPARVLRNDQEIKDCIKYCIALKKDVEKHKKGDASWKCSASDSSQE